MKHLGSARCFLTMDNNYTKRFKEIVAQSVKYGFKSGIKDPRELRLLLEDLGPTFVKIGQILSTRPDILPLDILTNFKKLQDDVSPGDFHIMRNLIEKELEGSIRDIFHSFEEVPPIASASLAEVYLARLKTGEEVVVKVQRPFVREKYWQIFKY